MEVIETAAAVGGSHQPKVIPLSIAELPPLVVCWRRLSVSNVSGDLASPRVGKTQMGTHLRMATPQDAAGIRAIYAPVVRETPISFEIVPPTEEEMGARVGKTLTRYPWLVCTAHERLLGYAYAGGHSERAAYQWSVNVSVYVHSRARRIGVGQVLYDTLFAVLRLQGFIRAYAGITLPNEASVGFHESFGFTSVGVFRRVGYKMGAWHDVGYWQMTLQSSNGRPSPPRPLPSLPDDGSLQEALSAGWMNAGCDMEAVVKAVDAENLAEANRETERSESTK